MRTLEELPKLPVYTIQHMAPSASQMESSISELEEPTTGSVSSTANASNLSTCGSSNDSHGDNTQSYSSGTVHSALAGGTSRIQQSISCSQIEYPQPKKPEKPKKDKKVIQYFPEKPIDHRKIFGFWVKKKKPKE